MTAFNEQLSSRLTGIEEIIEKYLPEETGLQKTVLEAMNYSVRAGGKRLRPMLMQETYHLFGGTEDALIQPFMAAIEMIHTYSLIHDDLPALDNDMYRRGIKTNHAVFGEAMAILAGDALLNYAFETASKAFDTARERGQLVQAAKAMKILAARPGIYGMIGGQVVDVEKTGKEISPEELDFIFRLKTGALIQCSMEIGAVLAGASEDAAAQVSELARKIGMAFQIQDDILDVTSTTEELGKPVHSDEKNDKTTYVTLYGLFEAEADVARLSEEALQMLAEMFPGQEVRETFMYALILYLIHRKK